MRLSRCLRSVNKMLEYYSGFNPSPLSIKQFIDFGKAASEQQSFIFLRQEVPVRLANIMREIQLLPESLLTQPSCRTVCEWYMQSFNDILRFEETGPPTDSVLRDFCETLITIRNRHSSVVQTMAEGVIEMKQSVKLDTSTENNIQYFLDRFYMSRISIRMLINQHTLLFGKQRKEAGVGQVGCIDPFCNVVHVIEDAAANARFLCDRYYLASPEIEITQVNAMVAPDAGSSSDSDGGVQSPITLVYVPSHLYHILFELLKNSMRAVVEHYPDTSDFPAIQLLVVNGKEDLTIKISDRGGGVPRSVSDMLFHYLYSTAPKPSASGDAAPLAGYGYGLPLSRLYARYFQGDLIVNSCEGYGTDAIIYLKALAKDANEVLPVFNKSCERHYQSALRAPDWSSHVLGANTGSAGGRNLSTWAAAPPAGTARC
ncbi:pyruvate dehydrogenase (acetyl-transferring) kinase, mitochondrial-like isoform X2 [Amphibalanus amphitrite]|uniref:pyruvate dehydrogenase (acetyl-transferring) kinase, mitochondrial-like isoform X2 n=1 Tax=Amphibalanus amphitrite TaxID=1232801 RepID=UPI001C8FBF15|nr:pyruvate dehydrogenase (acetyl-transferring) kinase, mitochondrial-like isoform X2 [Amphibalanus amphitrite]XP_043224508.1 pyruvate dehydrogenase (acetyl-transferring) kinase, mitochondrial-like isoform X2 [Amphibalanus amphitrite]